MKIKSMPYDKNGDFRITVEDLAYYASATNPPTLESERIRNHILGKEIIEEVI